jgi:hypothetical protein
MSPLVASPATSDLVAVFINPVVGLRDDLEPQFPTTRAPDKPGSQPHLGRVFVKWATLASVYLDIFDWVVDRRNRPAGALAEIQGLDCPPTHTGGKGWCPDPVHHKYIARKWTKNLANTHPEYSKDIQNFPSQFN